jgi:uncharacterized DUF497 family protein
MKVTGIEWDELNLAHLAAHPERGISEKEVEEVLLGRCARARAVDLRTAGKEPRRVVFGRTCSGRFLTVVVTPRPGGVLRPVTAWPMSAREEARYQAWLRTVRR